MIDFQTLKPVQCLAASVFFKKRRLLLCLPRQEGKTELGVRLVHNLISTPTTRQALFLAKSHPAAKKAVREKHLRIFDPKLFAVNTELVYNRKHPTACCFIDSVDKDPDRIRGGTYQLIHWSEVAFSRFENGVTTQDVLDKVIKPTLRKTDGYVILESTNNGLNGWHQLWENASDFGFHKLKITLSQLVEMGLVPVKEYEELKATTQPDVFRQEYECEFVTFSGKVYSEFSEGRHLISDMPYPEDWQTVVAGIDWGFEDATCILFAYVKDKKVHIFDEIYERRKTLDEIIEIINAHKGNLWPYGRLAAAADHDKARNEELIRRGIPCSPAKKADTLGNRLQVKEKFFKDQILIHPRCKFLIKDLQACAWDHKKSNEIDDSQCTWGHFDAEAALRYLIRELSDFEEEAPIKDPHEGIDSLSSFAWRDIAKRRVSGELYSGTS